VSTSLLAKVLWQAQVDELINRSPVFIEQTVVIMTQKALYGLDRTTGERLWKHIYNFQETSIVPIASNEETIIYGDDEGQIVALDGITGEVVWHRFIDDRENFYGINDLVAENGVLFAVSHPTVVEAIEVSTGRLLWQVSGVEKDIPGRAARLHLDNNDLYVVTIEVHILDVETGAINQVFDKNLPGALQLMNGKFYAQNSVWDLYTLNRLDTLKSPSYKTLYGDCELFRIPYTFSQEGFYGVGRCGGVFALEIKENKVRWEYRVESDATAPIAIYQGRLYALFSDGQIHAVNLESGQGIGFMETNLSVPVSSASGIIADEDMMVVTFGDENVWTFTAEEND
jgi:outer membrane protein assembly factor BamB